MTVATVNLIDEWAEEWDLVLRSGRLTPGSRELYERGCRQFRGWLRTAHPGVTEPTQVTPKHMHQWAEHLVTERHLAPATRHTRIIAVKKFWNYVADQPDSGVTTSPAAALELPDVKEVPPPVLDDADLAALLATCRPATFVDRRDEAMIRLLFDTGIRRGELIAIDLDHLDLAHQEVRVTGKTGTRIAPFGARTALALRKYLRVRSGRPGAGSPALFIGHRARPDGEQRLTGAGVLAMIGRRSERAGLGHVKPHQLRHTWAHDMLDNGATEGDLERLGGWSTGSRMVRHYGSAAADKRARKRARTLSRGDRV